MSLGPLSRPQQPFPLSLAYAQNHDGPVLVPPITYGLFAPGLFRSGHPSDRSYPFLRTLGLKSMLYLEPESLRPDLAAFAQEEGLIVHHIPLGEDADLFDDPAVEEHVKSALRLLLDAKNHPLLVFSNMGKGPTTLMCALVRLFQGWSLTSIFAEGDRFAGLTSGTESGAGGEQIREYIALFDIRTFEHDRSARPAWLQ